MRICREVFVVLLEGTEASGLDFRPVLGSASDDHLRVVRFDWPSYVIMGTGVVGCIYLFWCVWHGVDPVEWFR